MGELVPCTAAELLNQQLAQEEVNQICSLRLSINCLDDFQRAREDDAGINAVALREEYEIYIAVRNKHQIQGSKLLALLHVH